MYGITVGGRRKHGHGNNGTLPVWGIAAGLVLALCMPAGAGVAGAGTLKNTAHAVMWNGSVGPEDGGAAEIPECANTRCERFDLTVDLPGGVWNNKPGGVQVAIHWGGQPYDNLRLYIYRGNTRVAAGEGIISVAQSLLLPQAADGLYRIYVAWDPDSPSPSIAYQGLAQVEYPPNVNPVRPLLPDFIVLPQKNLSFDPGGIFFDTISAQYPTCYETEVQEEGARLCLRFDQNFGNAGEGLMDLRFALPHGQTPPTANAYQRIYSSTGNYFQDRLAGQVEFHVAHGHYHFKSFGLSSLWRVDTNGEGDRLPANAERGRQARHRGDAHALGPQGELLHGRHRHPFLGRKGRWTPDIQRAGLPGTRLERRRPGLLPPRHHQRMGGRLRLVSAGSIHGRERGAGRNLSAPDGSGSRPASGGVRPFQQLRRVYHPAVAHGECSQRTDSGHGPTVRRYGTLSVEWVGLAADPASPFERNSTDCACRPEVL